MRFAHSFGECLRWSKENVESATYQFARNADKYSFRKFCQVNPSSSTPSANLYSRLRVASLASYSEPWNINSTTVNLCVCVVNIAFILVGATN